MATPQPCTCCRHDEATTTKTVLTLTLPMCADCVACDPGLPHKTHNGRRIALGECASYFYGYALSDGRTLAYPGTPAHIRRWPKMYR